MTRVYADYAAAAPLRPQAQAAFAAALESGAGNASSVHWAGRAARACLESAREEIAAVIGAQPLEIVFTSGATEANNLALAGVAGATAMRRRIAVAASEHSSVLLPARALAEAGHRVDVLPIAASGELALATVEAAAPDVLAVALVNAETGIVQPCATLAAAVHARGGLVHVDAAQAAAVLALAVDELGADLLTLSACKLGAGAGAGALYVRRGTPLAPLLRGGAQERGLRSGTENVPAIAAFAAALAAAADRMVGERARLARLRARLRAGIRAVAPNACFASAPERERGAGDAGAPHLLNVMFPGLRGESLVAALDLEGVAVSAGSACAAGASEPSHVLLAMGWSREEAASAVRFSLGWASSAADVDAIVAALATVLGRARARQWESGWPAHAS